MELRYPRDFQSDDNMLVKSADVSVNSLFDIEVSLKFDHPFLMQELGFFKVKKELEDIAY